MPKNRDLTRQLVIFHFSDIHFGPGHRFNPPKAASGEEPDEEAFPTLLDKLQTEICGDDPKCPVVVCLTGDITQTASVDEFQRAEELIRGLTDQVILGKKRGLAAIFVVPGNHDVKFDSSNLGVRWQQWTEFYNRLYGTKIVREQPWEFMQLHDRVDDLGAVVLCINSAIYVEKDKPDEERGRLDVKQLSMIEESLEKFDQRKLQSAIRLALIHHHPVLIPALSEPGRGYDAVHNSGKLLTILRRHGFHLILHGHKHNPHTFTEDERSAHQTLPDQPILIAAGGSVGSTALPFLPRASNCYNAISVKWHPSGRQSRIRVETRGLNIFNSDCTERLPTRWTWETLRVDDRHFFGKDHVPFPGKHRVRKFNATKDADCEKRRIAVYMETRGNLPVVEVLPSLTPGQAYEAIMWIVPHPYGEPKPERDIPTEVSWSAGELFWVVMVRREQDPTFSARLTYWGPMLVQARMTFPDGSQACAYVYARMPELYSAVPDE